MAQVNTGTIAIPAVSKINKKPVTNGLGVE
jgi:hypothetical protein